MKVALSTVLPLIWIGTSIADYADNANAAIQTLQNKYYNVDNGLWRGTGGDMWWQCGQIVEIIARFGLADESFKQTAKDIISNTYAKSGNQIGHTNWHNDYYDDMGWWAMGWIASFDLTRDERYLATAKDLFEDMTGGWHTPCNGGIFWRKQGDSIASISNELFLSIAAHLANRVSADQKDNYIHWARMEWDWFWNSGVINSNSLVNDGVDMVTCKNTGKPVYTYNQGVVLAGLSELAKALSDGGYIEHAYAIARSTLSRLTEDNILTEPFPSPLDEQGSLFKGAFITGLSSLHSNEPQQQFADFFKHNADSVWNKAKNADGVFVDRFQGGSNNANSASHASGIAVLVAAAKA